MSPSDLLSFCVGDFNGDSIEDVILWTASADGQPRLVAAIGRIGDEYVAVEVGREAPSPVGSLEIGRRGAVYRPANSVSDHFFGQDTLVERGCDQGRTAYFWTGDAFRADKLAD